MLVPLFKYIYIYNIYIAINIKKPLKYTLEMSEFYLSRAI